MKIYNYHPETGEFLGESEAEKSPLEKNVFLIPANATTIKPPLKEEGRIAIFTGRWWESVAIPDPDPVPDPVPEPNPNAEIEQSFNQKLAEGFLLEGVRYPCDRDFQSHLQGLLLAWLVGISKSKDTVRIRTYAGAYVDLDQEAATTLAAALFAHVTSLYSEMWAAKDALVQE